MKKRIISLFMIVALLCSVVPLSVTVSAENTVEVDSWEELRDALQSSGEATVIVPENVTIERTFDHVLEYIDDLKITVNGKKTLELYGEIHFYNGLFINGLFNLNSADTELTVAGDSGTIVYHLYNTQDPLHWRGDMFYLTAGKLILGGNSYLEVDYYCAKTTVTTIYNQAVVGGTGGEVILNNAYLSGNTIIGQGIDFTFKKGTLYGKSMSNPAPSFHNVDLYMQSGSAAFNGCGFDRGIEEARDSTATLTMGADICVDIDDKTTDADKDYIVKNRPCAFFNIGFAKMTPEMPALSTNYELDNLYLGETLEISAMSLNQNTGYGENVKAVSEMEVLHDGEQITIESSRYSNVEFTFDFADAAPGRYDVFYCVHIVNNGLTVRTKNFRYVVNVIDEIGHVDLSLDKTNMDSLTSLSEYAGLSNIVWYEQNKTTGTWTQNPTSLRDTYTYAVEFSLLSIGGTRSFKNNYTVSVNGDAATYLGNGRWRFEYFKTGYLTRIEMYDIALPAPGQHPDFIAHKDNPPYSSYEIRWTPCEDGEFGEPMTADDTFKSDTLYLLEVILTADDGYEFDYYTDGNGSYADINRESASVYYLEPGNRSKIEAYTYYNTAYCISDVALYDIQYPIPGKMPDTDVMTNDPVGASEGDTQIEWSFENTGGAGFSTLEGRFKADRRHMAIVKLDTDADYWFATDNQGDLAVNVTFDGEPMNFAYATDTDSGYGCNEIEAARTYERASTVDGVFIDGRWLTDGMYLDSDHWGVQTEETVNKEAGYAYYNGGVLTLHDFEWETWGDYNAVDSYNPLTIRAEGESSLRSNANGIVTNNTLTLEGDGSLHLNSNGEGVFAMGDVAVESGIWTVEDAKYDGLWLFSSLTVNGGTLDVYGPQCGINGDDFPPVTVNGGTLIARAAVDCAIGWCDTEIADGAKVTVGTYDSDTLAPWDGVTDFAEYVYVEIAFESDVLLGDVNLDGTVNMRDVLRLYQHINGNAALTDAQALTAADMDGNHAVNMRDALALFQKVSEQ